MARSIRALRAALGVAAAVGGGKAYAADPLLLCISRTSSPDGAAVSASAFIKGDQIELTRASLNITFLRLEPPRPFPMTGLSFNYAVKAAAPLSITPDSIGLLYNSGGAPKECGPGVAIVEADGEEVYREPFRVRHGMCAPSVVLERSDPQSSRAMDRLLTAKTISVRFESDGGAAVLGDTFRGIAPEVRPQALIAAFENLVAGGASPAACQEFKANPFENLLPFQWVKRAKPSTR